jgi:hypothetical protein
VRIFTLPTDIEALPMSDAICISREALGVTRGHRYGTLSRMRSNSRAGKCFSLPSVSMRKRETVLTTSRAPRERIRSCARTRRSTPRDEAPRRGGGAITIPACKSSAASTNFDAAHTTARELNVTAPLRATLAIRRGTQNLPQFHRPTRPMRGELGLPGDRSMPPSATPIRHTSAMDFSRRLT